MVVLVILIVILIAGGGIYWMMSQADSAGGTDNQGGAFTTQTPLPTSGQATGQPTRVTTPTPVPTATGEPYMELTPTEEESTAPPTPVATATPTVTPTSVQGDQDQVRSFAVSGRNFEFSPTEIRVRQGDRVRIVFTSLDGTHDFVIDELAVATQQVSTGQTDAVEFVADQAGNFEFYCSVGNHRAMGMVGTLIVE